VTRQQMIDINADMGEGFGRWRIADDEALLKVVSSASVACGFHAGDPETMARTFALAKENGVAIGAHPGFADLAGFGRRQIPHSTGEIERLVAYQVGAAQAMAALAGHRITYVKAHGALGNLTETNHDVAAAVTRAVRAVDPSLICLTIALGAQHRLCREKGYPVRAEVFADRGYCGEGRMIPRAEPGAVITDPAAAAARAVNMVLSQAIPTREDRMIPTDMDSICIHSDTPAALAIAGAVRAALEKAGIAISPFAP